mmetsp:Transcript_4991/g.8662  ORF Transcript_4991/g.8662 Transcript_4991/m.8662 type:complete len:228 (-) Transcript_4991:745-1428(-)
MLTTTACFPYLYEICSIPVFPVSFPVAMKSSAANTDSDPMDTLSAPERKYSAATSSAVCTFPFSSVNPRIPPPTVSGTNTVSLASRSTSSIGMSPKGKSRKPVMFRKVTSSAPSLKYLLQSSTGLPRFLTLLSPSFSRTSYWSPLVTTRSPLSFARTSRHAITRFDSSAGTALLRGKPRPSDKPSPASFSPLRKDSNSFRPTAPDFSGWNCVAMMSPFWTDDVNSPP